MEVINERGEAVGSGGRREKPSVTQGFFGDIFPNSDLSGLTDAVGIDRLSVSFEVLRFDPDAFPVRATTHHADGGATLSSRYSRQLVGEREWEGVSVFVGVAEMPGGSWRGKLELNPSRLADPAGCRLVSAEYVAERVPDVLVGVLGFCGVRTVEPPEDWRLKRVDVARDFHGVTAPGVMIEGLRPLRRKSARMASVHHDPGLGGAQTLTVGSGAGMVRLYDQHAAYADKGAVAGDVRWEMQARSGWLERQGLMTWQDLSGFAVDRFADERWEWSRMGTEVTSRMSVAVRINALVCAGRLSPAKAQRLLGQLVAEAAGMAWVSDRKTVREYEGWKRELGVTPSADVLLGVPDEAVVSRLDWGSGFEVLSAVA